MWMKTAKVSIQDKYLKTSFTKLSNIFSNLNEISGKDTTIAMQENAFKICL